MFITIVQKNTLIDYKELLFSLLLSTTIQGLALNNGSFALLVLRVCGLVCNCDVGPDVFSDRGCLLFQVDLATGDLPERDYCGKCN